MLRIEKRYYETCRKRYLHIGEESSTIVKESSILNGSIDWGEKYG